MNKNVITIMTFFQRLYAAIFRYTDNTRPTAQKRKRSGSESDDASSNDILNTPQKKRLKSTSDYIYQTFFVNEENSDVCIKALGKTWNLHRAYLCQSDYFKCMFHGKWKESGESVIHLTIPDPNIDAKALNIALGSLYSDHVAVAPAQVASVLAAALLLQLPDLCAQCQSIMLDVIYDETAAYYNSAALLYGMQDIAGKTFKWLLKNLMPIQTPVLIKSLSQKQLCDLLSSPDLFVMQVEMDIYNLVKKWVFLQCNPSWSGQSKSDLVTDSQEYFRKHAENCKEKRFIESEDVCKYLPVFRLIRLPYIISDLNSEKVIEEDKIFPTSWLNPVYKLQWRRMLRLEQGFDSGPPGDDSVSDQVFNVLSMRCGRILPKTGEYCWRWIGFNYGFDLIVNYVNRLLSFRRNATSTPCTSSTSQASNRCILYRFSVIALDEKGQVTYEKSTEKTHGALSKDEEALVLHVDRKVAFPLYISVHLLFFTPEEVAASNLNHGEEEVPNNIPPEIEGGGNLRVGEEEVQL
ncbi:PREDICTED: germ cell-less protein-like 1 [Priapulus caudatus]|uniref:Germ cell-less protein-like 1 n=1 Tax=Priapulus caudatus TaxID=37621 RepID=A0ABM1DSU9_PRICU|nr:PREDICTED: germ cell-less protein-like 1 [Priapulus caudatus]